jgi:hypothetical protein
MLMKTLTILFVLSLGLGASTPSSSAAEPLAVVNETISGESFRAIEAGVVELRRLGLRAEDYQIFARRRGSLLVVLFGSPADADLLKFGCAGPRPCLTVELSVDDLRVIRSDYDLQNR